jgi:hypothetical protein
VGLGKEKKLLSKMFSFPQGLQKNVDFEWWLSRIFTALETDLLETLYRALKLY